ncbi:hypothetical protein M441DRAFT_208760 [Trichoderma asperellum CBS 433.97]|uniref:Uncharacterized protein n=1 Tax=Trichoderma asperellum (strain ATCC 204424 / CBS 433.97 / NBRC 101777) TaxID=1042311 RepID=A0A2T3ZMQ2_TRIA4|nr:hypothetical protein M441DRAFT_208760 [Trichoderma asperellum CBS 433.97]PTB46081.1 hypothetical protein M441DRAFT_208760 [Trichoderma asperellum CBS 433.97]
MPQLVPRQKLSAVAEIPEAHGTFLPGTRAQHGCLSKVHRPNLVIILPACNFMCFFALLPLIRAIQPHFRLSVLHSHPPSAERRPGCLRPANWIRRPRRGCCPCDCDCSLQLATLDARFSPTAAAIRRPRALGDCALSLRHWMVGNGAVASVSVFWTFPRG